MGRVGINTGRVRQVGLTGGRWHADPGRRGMLKEVLVGGWCDGVVRLYWHLSSCTTEICEAEM